MKVLYSHSCDHQTSKSMLLHSPRVIVDLVASRSRKEMTPVRLCLFSLHKKVIDELE